MKRVLDVAADGTAQVLVGDDPWQDASVRLRDLQGPSGPATRIKVVYDDDRTAMVARAFLAHSDANDPENLVLTPLLPAVGTALPPVFAVRCIFAGSQELHSSHINTSLCQLGRTGTSR